MDHNILTKYFPTLSPRQQAQFIHLGECYRFWNERINLISRKDIDQLYLHHVLHSLSIAKFIQFPDGAQVLDVGTGGGFPGIPLAILFPQTRFFLCDSIAKKIRVVNNIAQALELQNVTAVQIRAQDLTQSFDYAISRAVTRLDQFLLWVRNKINTGILYLKGGDVAEELDACARTFGIAQNRIQEIPIHQWFEDPYFEEKKIVYISINNSISIKNNELNLDI